MSEFVKGFKQYVESVYTAWFVVISAVMYLLFVHSHIFMIVFYLIGIALFAPILYKYHVQKTINIDGQPIKDD